MSSVVIIGASHAAAEAISTLKKKGYAGSVTLIGDEPYLPYQRPPLSKKYLNGEMTLDQLYIKGPAMYDEYGVVQKLGVRAERLDRTNKVVELSDNSELTYEHLILATGTRARELPVPGAQDQRIRYLRTKDDVDAIQGALSSESRVLIIGAGYIGLEVAASATQLGCQVTVLEAMDRVLQRVTGPEMSTFYQGVHADHGVDLRLDTAVKEFVTEGNSIAAVLGDESQIEFDLAVVGIGVIPNTELAESAGLECDNGIVVDEYCQTQDRSIYAVGDCSNHPSFIYERRLRLESVPNAMGQAKTAALHICGDPKPYDEVPWFWSDQYDVKLQTAGLSQGYDQVVLRGDMAARKFSVFYLDRGRLLAVDAINSPAEFMIAKKLVATRAQPDPNQLADSEISIKSLVA